jgi:hypothetical protein
MSTTSATTRSLAIYGAGPQAAQEIDPGNIVSRSMTRSLLE